MKQGRPKEGPTYVPDQKKKTPLLPFFRGFGARLAHQMFGGGGGVDIAFHPREWIQYRLFGKELLRPDGRVLDRQGDEWAKNERLRKRNRTHVLYRRTPSVA